MRDDVAAKPEIGYIPRRRPPTTGRRLFHAAIVLFALALCFFVPSFWGSFVVVAAIWAVISIISNKDNPDFGKRFWEVVRWGLCLFWGLTIFVGIPAWIIWLVLTQN